MPRLFATVMSALTIIALGIVALQFREQELSAGGLSGADAEALNLTREVSTDAMVIAGNALPRLLMIVIIVFVIVLLLLIRP